MSFGELKDSHKLFHDLGNASQIKECIVLLRLIYSVAMYFSSTSYKIDAVPIVGDLWTLALYIIALKEEKKVSFSVEYDTLAFLVFAAILC